MKLYYAHALNTYGTPQELRDLELLRKLFPHPHEIFSPNCFECAAGYKAKKMDYFIELITKEMDACAFRALPDGSIPAGIATEVKTFIEMGRPVIEIPSAFLRRILTPEQTRQFLQEVGY